MRYISKTLILSGLSPLVAFATDFGQTGITDEASGILALRLWLATTDVEMKADASLWGQSPQ